MFLGFFYIENGKNIIIRYVSNRYLFSTVLITLITKNRLLAWIKLVLSPRVSGLEGLRIVQLVEVSKELTTEVPDAAMM